MMANQNKQKPKKPAAEELRNWLEENGVLGTPKEIDAHVRNARKHDDPIAWLMANVLPEPGDDPPKADTSEFPPKDAPEGAGDGPPDESTPGESTAPEPPADEPAPCSVGSVTITIPIANIPLEELALPGVRKPGSQMSLRMPNPNDPIALPTKAAIAAMRIAMRDQNTELACGARVDSDSRVVRWILERIGLTLTNQGKDNGKKETS